MKNIKKITAVLLAVVMVFALSAVAFAETGKDDNIIPASDVFGQSCFCIDDFKLALDKDAAVELYIKNNSGIKTATVEIVPDANLQVQSIDFTDGVLGTAATEGNKITWTLSSASTANGKVATVTFKGLTEGDAKVEVKVSDVTDGADAPAEGFENTVTSVAISLTSAVYGDVTGDGVVDATDLVRLKKHLAGQKVEINEVNSDCTGDGNVDATDLVRLKKYLAGQQVVLGPDK